MGCGPSSQRVPRPLYPRPLSHRPSKSVRFEQPVIASLAPSVPRPHDPHPHTPREDDSPAVAHSRRVARATTEQWIEHHTQRAASHAVDEQAHVEGLRDETLARLREESDAHAAGLAEVRAEEARAHLAHLERVASDADLVHPREAREWATEHVHVRALVVLPCGTRVASASDDALVRVFALAPAAGAWVEGTCQAALAGHAGAVLCLTALARDALVSGGRDGKVCVWDLGGAGRCTRTLSAHRGAVLALAALQDTRFASAGEDGAVRLWVTDSPAASCQQTLWGHERHGEEGAVEAGREDVCALSAVLLQGGPGRFGARQAEPCLASGGMDGVVVLWDVPSAAPGSVRARLRGHTSCVNALLQLADGRLAASARDGSVRLWDVATYACEVLVGHPALVMCLAPHPDGERLLSGSADGSVHVWDVRHPDIWSVALEPQVHGHKDGVWCMAVLEDGTVLSGGFGATVRVWDVEESHIKWRPEASRMPPGKARSGGVVGQTAHTQLPATLGAGASGSAPPLRPPSPAGSASKTRSSRSLTASGRALLAAPLAGEGAGGSSGAGGQSLRFITR